MNGLKTPVFVLILCLTFSSSFLLAAEENNVSSDLPVKNIYEKKSPKVEVVADSLEYTREQKKIIAKGNVVVTYGDMKLTSDYAEVETETKKVYARGHVLIFGGEKPKAQGEEVYYDFANHSGSFPNGKTLDPPWYGYGEDIQQIREGVTVIKNGHVTTCDRENPHYEIRAKKATVHSGDKIVAYNVTIYVLGKPIFWWPYFVIPLRDNSLPFSVSAGYKSEYGAYVETSKGFAVNKHISGKILADWRAKRGFGGGGIVDYNYGKLGHGSFLGYWTQDRRAPITSPPTPTNGEDTTAYSQLEKRDRGRLLWRHRTDFDDYTNIILRYNRLADEYFLGDFFEKENRAEVEPQSFVTLTKNSERFGFLVTAQKRMNDFESIVERLPEVRFDWKNQPFFKPWLFYESQMSFANLAKTFGRSDMNEDTVRVDNFHEWSLPMKWKEIKFTPFANARGTFYTRNRFDNDSKLRLALGGGADLRTQFYKTHEATFDKMGIEINHLRHVFEPSITYVATHPSTLNAETELNHFDNVDKVDAQDVVSFGLENRLQTKRVIDGKMRRVDIVSLNTFLIYESHPNQLSPNNHYPHIDQEVVLRPYQWLQFQMRFNYDMRLREFRSFNQDFLIRARRFRLLFGQRYIKDASLFDVSEVEAAHQFVFDLRYMINPLWQVGGYVRWDADKHELQEWQVSATRDLHDFLLDFGYDVRQDAISNSNKQLFFNFRMKAFPDYNLRGGGSRANFGEPRIGETVAGSNQMDSRYHDSSLYPWGEGYYSGQPSGGRY